jgi:hypothetical protein
MVTKEENIWISFEDWQTKRKTYKNSLFDWIRIYWNRYIIMPYDDLIYKIKRSIGRIKYGVSRQDVWGLDYFIVEIIYKGLCELQTCKHGYGATFDPNTGKYEYDEQRWNDILQRMIWGFNILYRINNDELQWSGNLTDEQKKVMEGIFTDSRMTTPEEEKLVNDAWDLLKQYHGNLWD